MEELTVDQLLDKYPHLKKCTETTLFKSKEEVDELRNSEKVKVGSEEVSIEFLKKILNDDFYFEYASRYFNGDINVFSVNYIIYGDTGSYVYYNKTTIIKAIEQLLSSGQMVLQPDEKKRLDILKNKILFDKFLEKYNGNNFNIDLDGNSYSIPVRQLVSLMQLNDEEFDRLCSDESMKEVNGIPKNHFVYAALNFFKNNKVLEEYLMPDNIINRYMEIDSIQKIDLQAINKHLVTVDNKYQTVQLDDELEHEIISGIPENASDLEKGIYIYIKMCKLLTYDDEYFAVGQKGEATVKHKSIDHVSSITLKNNKVVCYEFNMIYSKLLNKFGIHFASDYKGFVGEAYGEGHANLEFRADKFLVTADAVTNILQGDIMQAKLNQPLIGLKCININEQTQIEFKETLSKVYRLVAEQDKSINNNRVEHKQTLEELLAEYSGRTQNIKDIDVNERLSILIDKVNSTRMVGVDSLSYVLQLRKVLFTKEQRNNNMGVSIIRNNEPLEEGRFAMASAIITLNRLSFEDKPDQNLYYYFNPNHELVQISVEDLQAKFNEGLFAYIAEDDPKIPGIIEKGGIKK